MAAVKRGTVRFLGYLLAMALLLGLRPQTALTIHGEEALPESGAESDSWELQGKEGLDSWWLEPDFAEGDYTMVVLPDTQFMVSAFTESYYKQMQWIADNKETLNIQAVMHMGDMINQNTAKEWTIFKNGTDILDEAGIPWMPMTGNHDLPDAMNKYFDYQTYGPGRSWFGGSFHGDKLNHTYWFVTVGEREYMILSLGWAPNWDVLDWAKEVVEAHPEKNVIVNCHALVNKDGTLLAPGKHHSITADLPGYPDGDDVWEAFSQYDNFVLAMSGHVGCPDIVPYAGSNAAGNDVYGLLIDNQSDGVSNSAGMIAVLTFHTDSNAVELNWYSTKLDAMYGPENQYAINVSHVNSGTTEAEDITQNFTSWTTGGPVRFADGIGYGEPGYTGGQDKQLKYSDFVRVEEYDRLELTLCTRSGYTSVGGFAFYSEDDPSAFLSHGADARNGNGGEVNGTTVRSVAVPEGAKYIRVTYWADSASQASVPFRCVGYKTVPDCVHTYQTTVTPPTCTEQGYTAHTCTLCGSRYLDSYVPAAGHSYSGWYTVEEATCTSDGQERRDCAACGFCETVTVTALGHSFESVFIEPTCTTPGGSMRICSRCGYEEPELGQVEITDQFVWSAGTAIQATTGNQVSDGNWMSSGYVDISAYPTIEIVTANTAAAGTVFGLAFYDANKNFVSGIRHTNGSGVYGVLVHEIAIPEDVVYIRTTWYSPQHPQYSSDFGSFYCLAGDEVYVPALGHTPGEPVVEDRGDHEELVTCCTLCGEELSRVRFYGYTTGDINGDGEIDIFDANLIVAFYNGTAELNAEQQAVADVNGDGEADIFDANLIVAYYNGTIEQFPIV